MTNAGPRGTPAPSGADPGPGHHRRRRIMLIGVGLASVAALSTPPAFAGPSHPTDAIHRSPTYVALGDSFTSGPDVPAQLTGDTTPSAPTACLRSSGNYASL